VLADPLIVTDARHDPDAARAAVEEGVRGDLREGDLRVTDEGLYVPAERGARIDIDERSDHAHELIGGLIGPGRCLVIAGIGISGEHSQPELAAILRDIERGLMRRPHIGLAIMTLATAEDRDL
jgi:hypothetical protein